MGDYTQVPNQPADSVATPSAQLDASAPDSNRPVSTIPADSTEATSSAQPEPADSVQPISEPSPQPDQVFEATASAEITPPADSEPTASPSADLQPATPISPQPASPVGGSLESPQSPQLSETHAPVVSPAPIEPQFPSLPVLSVAPKESDIQEPAPSNPPSQVQPETPKDTSVSQVQNTPPQSAGFNPEPLQGTQNAPSADVKVPESPKTSFGDLMGQPSDLSEEPAIHIDPIEAPPVAPETPPVTPPTKPTEENQQAERALRRQHATESRKQKREDNLAKILELVQKKGRVDNLDVRDFLHISQTTATDYLRSLVNSGKLKKEGKAKATTYSL